MKELQEAASALQRKLVWLTSENHSGVANSSLDQIMIPDAINCSLTHRPPLGIDAHGNPCEDAKPQNLKTPGKLVG
jgi:hypothetical protein